MEEQVQRLANKIWARYGQTYPDKRLLIAIGGIPGSGKTTLASQVVAAVNRRQSENAAAAPDEPVAIMVPMDGFHLTRAQLSAMPDPARAHARRGAAFTFDGPGFLALVQQLRLPVSRAATVFAPSFDHAIKDPVAGAIAVGPRQRVVVLEGNYVCLDREPWRTAAWLMDERWFVEAPDRAVVRARLVRRHLAAGIVTDEAAAGARADDNDLVNGDEIERERLAVDEVVISREDASWA